MKYTYELAWDNDGSEYPTIYLCQNGVRIALLYEDPILLEGQDPDLLRSWKPDSTTKELLETLRLGCEYRQAMNFIRKYL